MQGRFELQTDPMKLYVVFITNVCLGIDALFLCFQHEQTVAKLEYEKQLSRKAKL